VSKVNTKRLALSILALSPFVQIFTYGIYLPWFNLEIGRYTVEGKPVCWILKQIDELCIRKNAPISVLENWDNFEVMNDVRPFFICLWLAFLIFIAPYIYRLLLKWCVWVLGGVNAR